MDCHLLDLIRHPTKRRAKARRFCFASIEAAWEAPPQGSTCYEAIHSFFARGDGLLRVRSQ
jgi:hypothetical protein